MKKKLFIVAAGIITVLTSCSNNGDTADIAESDKNIYNIELVNNEKWVINEDMMVHIKKMETDIQSISTQTDPNYKELGSKLDTHIGLLTSNCTMTGKGHDELHKWLLPFIDLVNELNEAGSKKEQKDSFFAIEESMNEFNKYFK
ncbi:hypothetical protein K6119_01800 [Paracrocinitomix mangrovi]|uniref:hypothetical protein n=1 Tax=Paracrocinitomix mangrovi TaxID=2862509 RepID=UPI001C8F1433|nr:hypothetical protein [Paracrocinitomix mangrovi]UKN02251.1 hypothetical protein K6119_01800 [Paracrocinitomix mangrovi]